MCACMVIVFNQVTDLISDANYFNAFSISFWENVDLFVGSIIEPLVLIVITKTL
jgi:hypothetical protein